MSILIIENANIVLPDAVCTGQRLLIENGKIKSLDFKEISPKEAKVINAEGGYLFAGFIDLHVHGGGDADFMDATPKAFEDAVKAHLKHGTTLLYPTAVAAKHDAICDFINAYKKFRKESKYAKCAPGLHLEGPYFFGATGLSRGAQRADTLRLPAMDEVETLLKLADGDILRWDAAPELPGAYEFARRITKEGIICAVGHTDATAEETRLGFESGFSHITHFYNATSMHRKREQTVYAGVVEATYLDDNVTIELIGDGCHIPKEDVYLALKIKGSDCISVITDGTRLSGSNKMSGRLGSLTDGTDVIVEDNVAKLLDRTSFAGSIATMDRCLRVLCADYDISLPTASVMLSLSPAKRMGVSECKGSIAIGKDADLVITDTNFNIKSVILGGEIEL